jgi:hypothetical protein
MSQFNRYHSSRIFTAGKGCCGNRKSRTELVSTRSARSYYFLLSENYPQCRSPDFPRLPPDRP